MSLRATLETERKLRQHLPSSYVVVARPDHPYLLQGPDLLIGGEGSLTAIFCPTIRERQHYELLLIRLALTRLALPSRTLCMLLVDDLQEAPVSDAHQAQDFDLLEGYRNARAVASFIRDGRWNEATGQAITEVQRAVYARSSLLMDLSHQQLLNADRSTSPRELLRQTEYSHAYLQAWIRGGSPEQTCSRRLRRKEQLILGAAEFGRAHSDTRVLRPYCEALVRSEFSMDNGVPYLTDRTVNVLLVDREPYCRYDPDKLLRAAAFAGWLVAPASSKQDLEGIADRLEQETDRIGII